LQIFFTLQEKWQINIFLDLVYEWFGKFIVFFRKGHREDTFIFYYILQIVEEINYLKLTISPLIRK